MYLLNNPRLKARVVQAFFYQLTTTAAAIRANSNQMLTDDECQLFAGFSDRAERVHRHVEALREYVMQIREMYQLQIQLKQAAAIIIGELLYFRKKDLL